MREHSRKLGFEPSASLTVIEQRAGLLRKLRQFFYDLGFIEVETPLLASEIIPELHIEPIELEGGAFLQASPELHMKRLMASGAKAIFQVTRSFRRGEQGQLHNPEFTIVEWYRAGDDMLVGIELLDQLLQSLLGTTPSARTSYAEVFQQALGICPHTATIQGLSEAAKRTNVAIPDNMDRSDRDEWLNLLLATRIEHSLGRDRPEILFHYPATQASLAKTVVTDAGYYVAERFELYYRGIELANGLHELTDAAEQRRRFEAVNAARQIDGRGVLPLPESLLAAIKHGLPDCTGVALGFDRLVMLALGAQRVCDVMTFPSQRDIIE